MSRKNYLNLLRKQPTRWIVKSMESPSVYMTKTHIALHAIELRNRKGALA